jgi:hypothetical protein
MTKTFKDKTLFGFSNFGHWDLFDAWNLIFGIFTSRHPFDLLELLFYPFG